MVVYMYQGAQRCISAVLTRNGTAASGEDVYMKYAAATRTLATAAPTEVVTADAPLEPEEVDAAVEEADADADADGVSCVVLEDVDAVDDSVVVLEEPDELAEMVTSVSMLELPTVVVFESKEPTVASSTLDVALPAATALPASAVLAELLEIASIKVSSVSAVLEVLAALLLVLVSSSVLSSVLTRLFEPEPELTALEDVEARVDAELETSCAYTALMARAQARVTRRTCMDAGQASKARSAG
ncbi:unnamed protein product [Phytophthora fragariaefolia]|uniref:Unnamed protein product n=1 Tax=Phytophthora fragariaefolia TaxID=1490495 RepID=A0A9W6XTD0_9STRA|nr:unnamed protein product [Phytophthora fragariaefolia]